MPDKDIFDPIIGDPGKRIGERIRKIRRARGLSPAELGKMVDLPADRIQKYETGTRTPRIELAKKIADALDVSLYAIWELNVATPEAAMYTLFEFADKFRLDLVAEEDQIGFRMPELGMEQEADKEVSKLYNYFLEWFTKKDTRWIDKKEYDNLGDYMAKRIDHASSLHEWEWNFPKFYDKDTNDQNISGQIRNIKLQIIALQEELAKLESTQSDIEKNKQ